MTLSHMVSGNSSLQYGEIFTYSASNSTQPQWTWRVGRDTPSHLLLLISSSNFQLIYLLPYAHQLTFGLISSFLKYLHLYMERWLFPTIKYRLPIFKYLNWPDSYLLTLNWVTMPQMDIQKNKFSSKSIFTKISFHSNIIIFFFKLSTSFSYYHCAFTHTHFHILCVCSHTSIYSVYILTHTYTSIYCVYSHTHTYLCRYV